MEIPVVSARDEVELEQDMISYRVCEEVVRARDEEQSGGEALGEDLEGAGHDDHEEEEASGGVRRSTKQLWARPPLPGRSVEVVPNRGSREARGAAADDDAHVGERAPLLADDEGPGLDDCCAR
jgi:hypothetical protein